MENRKLLRQAIPYLAIVLLAVVARVVPHLPNFVPIGGLALFTGYHFKNKFAWVMPIAAMVLSDFVIGFHSTIPYVYGSFIIISAIGSFLKNRNGSSLFAAALTSSLVFFLITNFGVWAAGSMYAKNMSGLIQSYTMGIPFFRNTILGDLFYSFSFFYGFKYLSDFVSKKTVPSVQS